MLLGSLLVYGWGDRKARDLEDIAAALREGAAGWRRARDEEGDDGA